MGSGTAAPSGGKVNALGRCAPAEACGLRRRGVRPPTFPGGLLGEFRNADPAKQNGDTREEVGAAALSCDVPQGGGGGPPRRPEPQRAPHRASCQGGGRHSRSVLRRTPGRRRGSAACSPKPSGFVSGGGGAGRRSGATAVNRMPREEEGPSVSVNPSNCASARGQAPCRCRRRPRPRLA